MMLSAHADTFLHSNTDSFHEPVHHSHVHSRPHGTSRLMHVQHVESSFGSIDHSEACLQHPEGPPLPPTEENLWRHNGHRGGKPPRHNEKGKRHDGAAKAKKDKAASSRSWLKIDMSGTSSIINVEKHKLVNVLGVQMRDLRVLDPYLATSYPSGILCREKALVVHLEFIKVIITTNYVLLNNSDNMQVNDPQVAEFLHDLQTKLQRPPTVMGLSYPGHLADMASDQPNGEGGHADSLQQGLPHEQLPFELRALEICLERITSHWDLQLVKLEAEVHPALDRLLEQVNAKNLERVRRLKTRLNQLLSKVENVREVVERFLDNDQAMLDINLSGRQLLEMMSRKSSVDHHFAEEQARLAGASPSAFSVVSDHSTEVEENEIAEVEMLLEAYFIHLDSTKNHFVTLKEHIEDTEDLITIGLDQRRNSIISIDLMFTAGAFSIAIIGGVVGLFGMNVPSKRTTNPKWFLTVTLVSTGFAVLWFIAFMFACWRKKVIFFM